MKTIKGVLSKGLKVIDIAEAGNKLLEITLNRGLQDIEVFRNMTELFPEFPMEQRHSYPQGSLINWRKVDWADYGSQSSASTKEVMQNFIDDL